MSRDAAITRDFAGATRTLRLGLGEWEKIDVECGFGPTGAAVLFKRTALALEAVSKGDVHILALVDHRQLAKANDVRFVLFQGLLGGGEKPDAADKLLRVFVDGAGLAAHLDLAYALAMATLIEVADDALGECGGEAGSPSPISPEGG
jgi:hypothetical protein